MTRFALIFPLLLASALWGQNSTTLFVGTAPSGACTNGTPAQIVTGVGAIYGCVSGTWTDMTNGTATNHAPWYNVVTQGGFDNTGTTLEGAATVTLAGTQPVMFFPAGTYNFNDGAKFNCTSSTCSGYRIMGAGRDKTILKATSCTNGYVIWYNNTTNSGDNFKGMHLEHLTLDVSAAGTSCNDVVRYTQVAETVMNDVAIIGPGTSGSQIYATGTIAISGSTVTGTGTTFTAAMAPGVLQVNGIMAEVCSYTSATQVNLCDTAWPTGTVAGGTAYALTYGSRAVTCDPGFSYSQYMSFHDIYMTNVQFGYYSMGTSSGGCSRISVDGDAGWLGWSGSRGTNTVGMWLGKHSDTWRVSIPFNNFARGIVIDSGHANILANVDIENNSTYAPVTTCNGGVAAQACVDAVEISADASSTGYGNQITSLYPYLNNTAVMVDNANGATSLQVFGMRSASFSNTNSFSFSGVAGCPGNTSGIAATIVTWNCVHYQVTPTTN